MKNIFVLFLLCFASLSFAECNSRHHIFLLHGIGGGSGTFGSLETILNRQNPCNQTKTFIYNTGSFQTPYDFAKDFHQYVKNQNIRTNDKISLVMHSQGGLVGTLWLRHLLSENSPYVKILDSFITLSTPYWGTDIAHVGKTLFYTLPPGVKNPISPFGKNELNEMSYGSGTVLDFAQNLDAIYGNIPNLRTLTVAGMKTIYNSTLGEDDVVVPIHSMKAGNYYLKNHVNFFEKPILIPATQFTKSIERPFQIVTADHIKLLGYGVADIPSSCINNTNCGHPSLPLILTHLEGNKAVNRGFYKLTRFRVTMYVNNPAKTEYDEKELTIEVHGLEKDTKIPSIERFNPFLGNGRLEKGLAFSFGGMTKVTSPSKLLVTLKYKNKNVKTFEVPVEAGTSSFIDIVLN